MVTSAPRLHASLAAASCVYATCSGAGSAASSRAWSGGRRAVDRPKLGAHGLRCCADGRQLVLRKGVHGADWEQLPEGHCCALPYSCASA